MRSGRSSTNRSALTWLNYIELDEGSLFETTSIIIYVKPPVICICGPSGAGKTTVVKSLSHKHSTYLEDVSNNPYIHALGPGVTDFDAAANQRWFLQRVGEFVRLADPTHGLVIDQDPAVIVKVYARMFCDEGRFAIPDYTALLSSLELIEHNLSRWRTPRQRIFLDAAPGLLRERVLKSHGDRQVPSVDWFSRLRKYFNAFLSDVPDVTTVSTDQCSIQQVIGLVSQLIITHS